MFQRFTSTRFIVNHHSFLIDSDFKEKFFIGLGRHSIGKFIEIYERRNLDVVLNLLLMLEWRKKSTHNEESFSAYFDFFGKRLMECYPKDYELLKKYENKILDKIKIHNTFA